MSSKPSVDGVDRRAGNAAKSVPSDAAGCATLDPLALQFRHHAGKVSRQASVFLSGTIFLVLGGYLFKIYVSRKLGAQGLGIYALGMSTVAFFSLFSSLGLPQAAARFVAVYRSAGQTAQIRRFFSRTLLLLLFSCGTLGAMMLAVSRWISDVVYDEPELGRHMPLFAVILILSTVYTFLGQYLRGHQEVTRHTVISYFIFLPAKILVTVGLFSLGWGVSGYIAAELFSLLLVTSLLAAVARRLTPRTDTSRAPGPGQEVYGFAASMAFLGLLGFFAGRADQLLLGVFLHAEQVGIYSIAVATAAFVPTLLKALNSIFGPIVADLHARHQTELLRRLFQTSTKWCLALTWPLVVVIVLFSHELMRLFGASFEAGAPVLALLAVAQLINVGVGSVGNLLVMSGHQRLEIWNASLTAALTLPLNFLLIPRWGMMGAATALAFGVIGSNLLRTWLVRRYLGMWPYSRHHLATAVPLAISALAAFGVRLGSGPERTVLAMLVAVLAAYCTFAAAAALFLDRDDRIILRAVWEKLRHHRQRFRLRRA